MIGLKIGFGFFLSVIVLFGLVFAVGFHSANEIVGGIFQGNYTFNGTINFSSSTIVGIDTILSGFTLTYNSSSCPSGYTNSTAPISLVSVSEGTGIGTSTLNGGLAAAYDGVTIQANAGSSVSSTGGTQYLGKDWGSGNTKIIDQVIWYSTTEGNAAPLNSNFSVYGSNDNFVSQNIRLGSKLLDSIAGNYAFSIPINDKTTAYRYHRIAVITGQVNTGELEFYESATSVTCVKD